LGKDLLGATVSRPPDRVGLVGGGVKLDLAHSVEGSVRGDH
jgi:hypothetical protein